MCKGHASCRSFGGGVSSDAGQGISLCDISVLLGAGGVVARLAAAEARVAELEQNARTDRENMKDYLHRRRAEFKRMDATSGAHRGAAASLQAAAALPRHPAARLDSPCRPGASGSCHAKGLCYPAAAQLPSDVITLCGVTLSMPCTGRGAGWDGHTA